LYIKVNRLNRDTLTFQKTSAETGL